MRKLIVLSVFFWGVLVQGQSKYEKEFAYINTKGEVAFTIYAKYAYGFQNGRAEIAKYTIVGEKSYYRRGFIDTKGEIIVPCIYDKVKDFKTTATFVRKPDHKEYTLIDLNGKELTTREFDKPGYFFEGMASFKENDRMGFVDSTGKIRIAPAYLGASYFSEGLVCVMPYDAESEKYGFINKDGDVVIPYQYKQAGFTSFQNGLARVKIGGKAALINQKGEVEVQTNFSTVSGFSEGLLMVAQGKSFNDFGYADFHGNFVIKGPYYSVKPFEKGVAVVSKSSNEQGLIDITGKVIIPLEYETVYNNLVESNYIGTVKGREWEYFTKEGLPFTEANVSWIGSANYTELMPYKDADTEKYGFLNRDGEVVIPATFRTAKEFSKDGLALVEL